MLTDRDREILANIAANVRRLREDAGLSTYELAEKIDEYQPTIWRLEEAKNMPGAGLLARIAESLEVPADVLLAPPPVAARKKLSRAS